MPMVVLFVFLFSFSTLTNAVTDTEWVAYKEKYGKVYTNGSDDDLRRLMYEESVRYIHQHNIAADQGKYSYWLGINQFTDEIENRRHKRSTSSPCFIHSDLTNIKSTCTPKAVSGPIPETVNWTQKGYVMAVKNQGSCGSCWAFAATGALEGQYFKANGNPLSEQHLIDCSNGYGNMGCGGGNYIRAFKFVRDNGGIQSSQSYPYEAKNGTCRQDSRYYVLKLKGYHLINENDRDIKKACGQYGPIPVTLYTERAFQLYSAGVLTLRECNRNHTHAVLLVGYGNDNGKDYWLIKNSHGTGYGQNGYIKIERNTGYQCLKHPVIPCVATYSASSGNWHATGSPKNEHFLLRLFVIFLVIFFIRYS